jgi:murein DD-endopeptidase MepM/ murein hydrolase activator NlpD
MPIQAPQRNVTENPFLHALDNRPSRPPSVGMTSQGVTFPAPPPRIPARRRTRPIKRWAARSTAALIWGLLFLLLGWPLVSQWKPQQSSTKTESPERKLPVQAAYVSSRFGPRWGRMHQGIDFAAQTGTPIHAMASGTVIHSGWEAGYGKSIVLEHDSGMQTRYAHCSKLLVRKGERVNQGDEIAKVGSTGHSTGPHLHFEVIVDGQRRNPVWYYPLEAGPKLASNH